MKVLLDAQPLLGPQSGISRYVRNLYQNLLELDHLDVTLAFNRIVKPINNSIISAEIQSSLITNQRYPYKVIRRLLKPNFLYNLPYDILSQKKTDLFHGTNFIYTPIYHGKTVVTIHDLAFMKYPESTSARIYKHHSRWVPYSARHCDHIIADSFHTKKDIIEMLHVPESKIDVIHLAADQSFKPLPPEQYKLVLQYYDLPEQYILFVGTLEPRKNLLGLLQAYQILKSNYKITEKLVIVGAKGWKYSPIFEWIEKHQLQEDVIFTGFIDDKDLVSIYNGASVFVMPSIYEGFGLPLLEAMKCGIPVIGSNVSSIPEIIGTHGGLIPPHEYEQWALHIYSLLTDGALRNKFSKLSLERAQQFTWKKTALETKRVYEKLL